MRNKGFLLVDVMIATMVLALMVGSVAGSLAAQTAARARADARNRAAQCFDEAIAVIAADPLRGAGSCGEMNWRIQHNGKKEIWNASLQDRDQITLELPPR